MTGARRAARLALTAACAIDAIAAWLAPLCMELAQAWPVDGTAERVALSAFLELVAAVAFAASLELIPDE